jgi:integrase
MKVAKSPNGEGSVYQRKSDGVWCAAVTAEGRASPKILYGKTRAEAIRKRRQLLAEVEAGRPQPAGRTPTLGAYLIDWLRVRIAYDVETGAIEPGTARDYADKVRCYLLTHPIAKILLPKLTPKDIRDWQLDLLRTPLRRQPKGAAKPQMLSRRTVGMAHGTLRRALRDAEIDGLLDRNVARVVGGPGGQTRPVEAPSGDEIDSLIAEMTADNHAVLWWTMLSLGPRKGEALGMRWSLTDVDNPDAAWTKLFRQIVREGDPYLDLSAPWTPRRTELREKDTLKTDESEATLALPRALAEMLREHRRRQVAQRLAAKVWRDPDLIFTTVIGTALDPRNVNSLWHAVCDRAGVRRLRPHDLRHAAASLAFAAGASIKEIQAMLRHKQESTTSNIYVKVFAPVRAGTAARMDGVMTNLMARRGGRTTEVAEPA